MKKLFTVLFLLVVTHSLSAITDAEAGKLVRLPTIASIIQGSDLDLQARVAFPENQIVRISCHNNSAFIGEIGTIIEPAGHVHGIVYYRVAVVTKSNNTFITLVSEKSLYQLHFS